MNNWWRYAFLTQLSTIAASIRESEIWVIYQIMAVICAVIGWVKGID